MENGHFKQALQLDPNFALAHAALAEAYIRSAINGGISSEEATPNARAAALKALELDGTPAEAHTALAELYFHYDLWNWAAAEEELERALQVNPGYATAYMRHAFHLNAMGRVEEAIAAGERGRELDPLSPNTNGTLAWVYYFARHYDRAIEQSRLVLAMEPNNALALVALGFSYLQKGMYQEASTAAEKTVNLDDPATKYPLAMVYAAAGKRAEALEILGELKKIRFSPYLMATIYGRLGEKDQAFVWLEKAYEIRDLTLVRVKNSPHLDSLRDDPRFDDLIGRLGLS